jgi:hypothetical protein
MIIVKLIGGLGNQLFQYALGRNLAERNSTILKLDLSGFEEYKLQRYGLHCFEIWEHIASIEEIETFKRKRITHFSNLISRVIRSLGFSSYPTSFFYQHPKYLKEKEGDFDPSILDTTGNIYLDGYWQSEKYFYGIREILLREFVIKYEPDFMNTKLINVISKHESVSLHIRRADYVLDPLTNQVHGVCSMDYYKKAVNILGQKVQNCHFFIFSDDHKWVRKNFIIDYPFTIINQNDASKNFEDLRLMSLCKHNIIANSTFSWWGAWLNKNPNKIVIAPKKWFADDELNAQTIDLIPLSWFRL